MEKKDLSSESIVDLVSIVEHPENFVAFMVDLASKELKKRNIPEDDLIGVAEKLYREKCKTLFEGSLFKFDAYTLPSSSILKKLQRKSLFINEFEIFRSKRNMMNSDLGSYGRSGG